MGKAPPYRFRSLARFAHLATRAIPFAAWGALFLAGCDRTAGVEDPPDRARHAPEAQARIVPAETVRIGPCGEHPPQDEATLLAQRILEAPPGRLQVDASERAALAREIGSVLRLVRHTFPVAREIRVRPRHAPGQVLVHFETGLWEAVASAAQDVEDGRIKLNTSHPEFDTLSSDLGLSAIDLYPRFESALLCFHDRLDADEAAAAYSLLPGVIAAEPNSMLVDGPDIHALRAGDRWIVVAEDAHGDCPSGCIFREFHFFAVSNGTAERLEPEEADRLLGRPGQRSPIQGMNLPSSSGLPERSGHWLALLDDENPRLHKTGGGWLLARQNGHANGEISATLPAFRGGTPSST